MIMRYKDLPNKLVEVFKYSNNRKYVASDSLKEFQKPSKKKKEIEKEVEEVVAFTVLTLSNTTNGRTPQKEPSSSISSDAPLRKKKLRKVVVLDEIEEEEEEEDVGVSLVRRKMNADVAIQKSVVESNFRGANYQPLLEHVEKHPETFDALLEEADVDRDVVEIPEV